MQDGNATEKRAYMRLYVRDFLLDEVVEDMSLEALGAYILILCHSWKSTTPGVISFERILKWGRLTTLSDAESKQVLLELTPAFRTQEGNWVQKRMKAEHARLEKDKTRKSAPIPKIFRAVSAPIPSGIREVSSYTQTQTQTQIKKIYVGMFSQLWDEYPRRVGKAAASKSWVTMTRGLNEEEVEKLGKEVWDGIVRWVKHWENARTEPQYIPHMATFLNQRRYQETPV